MGPTNENMPEIWFSCISNDFFANKKSIKLTEAFLHFEAIKIIKKYRTKEMCVCVIHNEYMADQYYGRKSSIKSILWHVTYYLRL